MPNKDGTGPNGEGAKTGRQRGTCEGKNTQECFRKNRRLGCNRRRLNE